MSRNMSGMWNKLASNSRFPSAPTHIPQLDESLQANGMASLPRYQQPSYFTSAPSNLPSPNAAARQASFPSRPPWPLHVQSSELQYPETPSDSSYSSRTPASAGYFPESPAAQAVGYPESSQRTLLPEAAYSGVYTNTYHATGMSFRDDASLAMRIDENPSSVSPNIGVGALLQDNNEARRMAYGVSAQYVGAPVDLHVTRVSPHLMANPVASNLLPGHPRLQVFPNQAPTSPFQSLASDTSSLTDAQSPRMLASVPALRRGSFDSLSDPISPSAVPQLVYDADVGEDYDDDSESSLPSAASEMSRASYCGGGVSGGWSQDADFEGWTRSPYGGAYGASNAQAFDSAHHSQPHGPPLSPESESKVALASPDSMPSDRHKAPQKKSKMHQCNICQKMFPRPSGLATHMNSHSGAKPFKCPIPTCTKSFAVRSNAKRHLRTHGIFPTSDHASTSPSQFMVGFDPPVVSEVREVCKLPSKLRWVPQSLATRTNVDYLRDAPSDSEDEYLRTSCPLLSAPLPPVSPSWDADDVYEERDSYADASPSPYLPSQWRGLPGPARIASTSF